MATTTRIFLGGLAAITALGISAGPVFAAGPPSGSPTTAVPGDAKAPASVPAIQAKAAKAVQVRETALGKAATRVQKATWLGADQAALLATIQGDQQKLQALGQKIAADSDLATAKADYEDIFSQYRVYDVVLPVTRMVVTADRITAQVGPKLTAVAQRLQAKETTADSAQVSPLLSDLTSKVASATSAVNGLAAQVIDVTPAAYDANTSVLKTPEAAVKTAAGDVKAALADAKQARSLERGARGGRKGRPQQRPAGSGAGPAGVPATASAAFTPTV